MDAPSGHPYRLERNESLDTIHHIRWIDPAGPMKNNTYLTIIVDNITGEITMPYTLDSKIARIMQKAQDLVNTINAADGILTGHALKLTNELEPMLQEYRSGFRGHIMGLTEMLIEDGLAEWRAVGPEDRELFATKALTGE